MGTRLASIAMLLMGLAPAAADTGEGSLRPFVEVRRGPLALPGAEPATDTLLGGGLVAGYGLTFPLTLTVRYGFDVSAERRVTDGARREEWRQRRHVALAGLAWAPSDELTPVLGVEAGAAVRSLTGRRLRVGADARARHTGEGSRVDVVPAARVSAAFEWRFLDFWSVAAGVFGEYTDAPGYGASLVVAAYSYL